MIRSVAYFDRIRIREKKNVLFISYIISPHIPLVEKEDEMNPKSWKIELETKSSGFESLVLSELL